MADAVILDYSAVVFEISMLGKPMYFYAFDYDSYMKSRDVYIDFKKYVPGIITGDTQKLMAAIDNNESDSGRQKEFRDLMISRPKRKAAVIQLMLLILSKKFCGNNRKERGSEKDGKSLNYCTYI